MNANQPGEPGNPFKRPDDAPLSGLAMLGDFVGEREDIDGNHMDPKIFAELSRPWTRERPSCPFTWMVSYSGRGALANIRVFENGRRHCKLEFPVRVFFSRASDAIVSGYVPLEAIREAHVLEYFDLFYEVPVEEAKAILGKHPVWPYDGRNRDLAYAELRVSGFDIELSVRKSRERLKAMGVTIPPKF